MISISLFLTNIISWLYISENKQSWGLIVLAFIYTFGYVIDSKSDSSYKLLNTFKSLYWLTQKQNPLKGIVSVLVIYKDKMDMELLVITILDNDIETYLLVNWLIYDHIPETAKML